MHTKVQQEQENEQQHSSNPSGDANDKCKSSNFRKEKEILDQDEWIRLVHEGPCCSHPEE
ncbi:hypothetical protein [Aureibacter tunicatorum]|uniref:Uncharacterized protein n=1 Tax=Aureibacter tunicatorum TaxID=866807 RepID=A0AAE3XKN9_9BACT|nr:hypothetical protein [Aureibacter tunicatorum]MDR6237764.1 hypothetical protein [Aureibacter tunicatorum]BDD02799.1 hypothetical protein AUTU_02820 [Aureibacter tunicatorum]